MYYESLLQGTRFPGLGGKKIFKNVDGGSGNVPATGNLALIYEQVFMLYHAKYDLAAMKRNCTLLLLAILVLH